MCGEGGMERGEESGRGRRWRIGNGTDHRRGEENDNFCFAFSVDGNM